MDYYIIYILIWFVKKRGVCFLPQIYFCDAEKIGYLYDKMLMLIPKERAEKANKLFKENDRILSAAAGFMVTEIFGKDAFEKMSYSEHGKPFFEHGKHFSISHSGKFAVLAVSEGNIGIDIETKVSSDERVARRCFTEEEQAFAKMSTENFLRIWTAKEAVLKFLGTGFSFSPSGFSVLPLNEEHLINGEKMQFFCGKIGEYPFTAAYCEDNDEFLIRELIPEDIEKERAL